MKTYELIFTILAAVLLSVSFVNSVLWLVYLKKNKNASAVYSLTNRLVDLFLIFVFAFSLIKADNTFKPFWIMMIATVIINTPASSGTIVTEKGLCNYVLCVRRTVPAQNVSYQYNGKNLELYANNQKRTFRFNIKNIKTVKLLADWYPKYGFSNPILPQEADDSNDKGE